MADPLVPQISPAELASRLGDVLVVDVRQPDEYVSGHARTAQLIPLAEVPDHAGELPRDQEVYVVCRSGGRSTMAAEFLIGQGVQAVNVAGGMLAWVDAGLEVVEGNQPA